MAKVYWKGTADSTAPVDTGSIDSVDATPANNTFTVTIGGYAISSVGDTDVATTATNLRTALNASTHPYFAAITWSGTAGSIIGTGDTAGAPFVAALTETGAGTGAVTDFASTTAVSSPNHWDVADNWSGGTVPVNADDVIIRDGSSNICWGLSQGAVDLDSLTIEQTYTGKIGLNRVVFATSADGDTTDAAQIEYRDHYLDIGWTLCEIGQSLGTGSPSGSGRLKLDNDKAGSSTTIIHQTASSASESGLPSVRLLAANSSANVYVRSAQSGVGVAIDEPGEVSTIGVFSVSDKTALSNIVIGEGVTLTTFEQSGGSGIVKAAATIATMTVDGGTVTTEGDYTITTLNQTAGRIVCNHIKTAGNAITTANISGGTIDGKESNRARTWATVNLSAGGSIEADGGVITITTFNEPTTPYLITAV